MVTFQTWFFYGMKESIPDLMVRGGTVLNVGAGRAMIPGAIPVDRDPVQPNTVMWNADGFDGMPFEDGSVDMIHAYHFLEHVAEPALVMREFERVLCHGGVLNVVVPYYMGGMAYQDLTHKHFFTEDTWRILMDQDYYGSDKPWKLKLNVNLVMGTSARTLALFTQFYKGD